MDPLAEADPERILAGQGELIGSQLQKALAEHPLDCIETEYPHYQGSIESPEAEIQPSERHPVFFGCFDWHSAVHSHWCLIRQLRLFDDHPRDPEMISSIEGRLSEENIEQEVAYFEENPNFEKPYGWAWLLRLASELVLWDDDRANAWRERIKPLESKIVSLVETEFLTQDRPFRVGTHQNSAFALAFVLDYANVTGNESLAGGARETAKGFFYDDRKYPVEYEPMGWDFLSPALTETDLMRRVLGGRDFTDWIDGFVPDLTRSPYDAVLEPVDVDPDPEEGVALHLVGMNISKAWCLIALAETLGEHRYTALFEDSAKRHARAGLDLAFTDEYAGSHWLSSFVLYLLTRNDGGIGVES
ncbi:MAG: DUF2891 domain-containing protein [Halapricum sp.]